MISRRRDPDLRTTSCSRRNTSEIISVADARRLFADWKSAPALVLAVSGGPDSLALMWLAARWRKALKAGPRLVAVTVDHGLRAEAAREARDVKRLATSLGIEHRTLRWTGAKPKTGLPAAARDARYRLLTRAPANSVRRMSSPPIPGTIRPKPSSCGCRAAAASRAWRPWRVKSARDGVILVRPLLDMPKARLVATLTKAGIRVCG